MEWSFVSADQLMLMIEVHKKILVFRDIMDLAPLNTSICLREVLYAFFMFNKRDLSFLLFLPPQYLSFICHLADGY